MKEYSQQDSTASASSLVAGADYYWEGALIVFTARYLLRRGFCCDSGCRHCPYRKVMSRPSSIEQGIEEERQREE